MKKALLLSSLLRCRSRHGEVKWLDLPELLRQGSCGAHMAVWLCSLCTEPLCFMTSLSQEIISCWNEYVTVEQNAKWKPLTTLSPPLPAAHARTRTLPIAYVILCVLCGISALMPACSPRVTTILNILFIISCLKKLFLELQMIHCIQSSGTCMDPDCLV